MRRMLDPKEAGGSLPSTITFDSEGNRTVGKNLGVDGKLTLKSLVSATNPDGDITKELGGGGGGKIYWHHIKISRGLDRTVSCEYYSSDGTELTYDKIHDILRSTYLNCTGFIKDGNNLYIPQYLAWYNVDNIAAFSHNISDGSAFNFSLSRSSNYSVSDTVSPIN